MDENEYLFIEEVEQPKKKTPHPFGDIEKAPAKARELRTNSHFFFTNLFSAAALLVFLGLLVLNQDVPEYFIGMIGAILGYYLSKKPFE